MTPSLSSSGPSVASLAKKALTASPAGRCTTGCTETLNRVDVLARAVELVAAMQLPFEQASAVLAKLVEGAG
jgi:hypothetical protein